MNKLRLGLPLVILSGWLAATGCDDDRGVVDLGSGGTDGQEQGGAGAGGDAANPGGGGASGGSVVGGNGGAAAGAGGAGGAEECPTDPFEADGTPCSTEGKECLIGSDDPCGFGQFLTCFGGEWQHQEAFPAECGGAGGAGGAGGTAGGAGGAGGAN